MDNSFEKRMENIRLKKNNIIMKMRDEKEIIEHLKKTDSKWSFFIRDVLNNKINIYEETDLSAEEYLKLKESKSDIAFMERFEEKKELISKSNGSRYYQKLNINIGVICDAKFYDTFQSAANLKVINERYSLSELEEMDVLIISNFKSGLYGDWEKGILDENNIITILQIIRDFKKLNKPVVFYDHHKEAYSNSLIIAKECDQVFTSTNNKASYYKENSIYNVKTSSYTVNPIVHNPIGMKASSAINGVLYQGSWFTEGVLEYMLDGVINTKKDLKILDYEFYNLKNTANFPVEYFPYISPTSSEYDYDLPIFYDYSIVYNDIEKVYELQALGNVIFSNYHPDINNKFPNVFTVDSHFETSSIIESLSKKDIYKLQNEGIRNVMSNYLCFEKMECVLNSVGINCSVPEKKVLVIGNNNSKEQYEKQSYNNSYYVNFEVLSSDLLDSYDFVTYFDEKYYYEEYYLEDLINGFKYTNSDFVAKNYGNNILESFTFSNEILDVNQTMFCTKSFTLEEIKNKNFNRDTIYKGFYIDDLEVRNNSKEIQKNTISNKEKKLSVIVPIYNNGKFLEYKCFASLKRSSIFEQMEIIFVDDGSTDSETNTIVDRLYREYDNVILYKFKDNGSGSASRPRNKGIELSTCQYITYLDPDNEAINDGYAQLLNEITQDNNVDIVVGNISRYDSLLLKKEINYYKAAYKITNSNLVNNPLELLKKSNLKVQSIQALVVNKYIILNNNLKMVESAAGQDTLFFQQLLTKANKMKIIDLNIHVYYAAVDNSVTNTVSSKFYEKYYKVEKERIKFLRDNNLFDIYMTNKFQFYFINWYLKKLTTVKVGEERKSLEVLNKIYKIYEPYINDKHELLKVFTKYMEKERYESFVNYCKDYFTKTV